GDRRAVSYPRLVLDLHHAQRGVEFLEQIVFLVVDGRPAQVSYSQGPAHHRAFVLGATRLGLLPSGIAGLFYPMSHHVHRLLQRDPLPPGAARPTVENVFLAVATSHQLKGGLPFGAETPLRDRRVWIALDVGDPFVFDVDELAASDGTIGAHRFHNPVG